MKITCGVYKITSPSGKIYIGSSINIERRLLNYKYLQCQQQPKLFNSLKKHGPDNHLFEIIEECDVKKLINREKYWVENFNSIKNGLNLQIPGNNQVHIKKTISFNKNWCSRISESKKGKSIPNVKKPIIQYDLKGNFINEYESAKEAQRQTGINNSAINNNLKGISKHSGGFIWKYKK